VFVIDTLILICGNDTDAKLACGTPRAKVQRGWVVPSFHDRIAARTRTRACPLGRARGTIDLTTELGVSPSKANKTTKQ
jgi:hypothetical protein